MLRLFLFLMPGLMKVLIQAGRSESLVFLTQLHALEKSSEIAKISFAVNHSEACDVIQTKRPVPSSRLQIM